MSPRKRRNRRPDRGWERKLQEETYDLAPDLTEVSVCWCAHKGGRSYWYKRTAGRAQAAVTGKRCNKVIEILGYTKDLDAENDASSTVWAWLEVYGAPPRPVFTRAPADQIGGVS